MDNCLTDDWQIKKTEFTINGACKHRRNFKEHNQLDTDYLKEGVEFSERHYKKRRLGKIDTERLY